MSIGKNITKFRKMKEWTQAELGERLGVSNQAVSKWESEMTMPDVMLLPQIAQVLGVEIQDLYDESGSNSREQIDIRPEKDRRILNISYQDKEIKAKVKIPVAALKAALSLGLNEEDAKEMAPFLAFLESDMDIDADLPEGHASVAVTDDEN